jgi:triosephosphate isomerase
MIQTKKTAKKYVVANWKMHGNLKQNQSLLEAYIQHLSNLERHKWLSVRLTLILLNCKECSRKLILPGVRKI